MALSTSDIKIIVDAETAKASKDIKRLTKELDVMNKKIASGSRANAGEVGQMTRSFKSLTAHVSKLALIYGTFKTLLSSTVITAQFEQSIKQLGIFSGATAVELGELEERAKELGESTIFSASQVAEGMNQMALAGLQTNEMLGGIDDVLNLASVGMMSLAEATDYTTTIMKAYDLEASDINDITDVLAKTSTISATSITELGQGFKKVSSVAKTYGLSVAETASAMSILADAGRRGSEGANQLKIVLLRLGGNKEALKYLDQLGVSMYKIGEDGQRTLLPFTEQLKVLSVALKGMDDKARNIKLGQIFGTEAVASAIVLIDKYEKINENLAILKQAMAEDFAERSAKEMIDTLTGSYKSLLSALEGLAIKIISELTPALREMLDGFTEMVRGMDDETIYDVSESITFLIEVLTGLSSAVAGVGGFVLDMAQNNRKLVGATFAVAVALKFMGKEMRALLATMMLNPVFAGLTAVIALTLAYADAVDASAKAVEKELALQTKRGETFSRVVDQIVQATDRETGAIGKTNVERALLANKVSDVIASLIKERDSMDKSSMNAEEYAEKQELLNDQIDSLDRKLVQIGKSWVKESDAIATVTAKQIGLTKATSDALANYEKFRIVANKRYEAVGKVIDKLQAKEEKLRDKVKALEDEKLAIFREYADKRSQVDQNYDTLLYNARTKDLNDHKKYLEDKKRATELVSKAQQALDAGNIAEASRYYEEAKSLATGFAGHVIKENDKVLVDSEQTYKDAEAIYKQTKEGEKAVLEKQQQAELKANADKLKYINIELKATLAQIKGQEALAKVILQVGEKWSERIAEFDNLEIFEEAKKDLRELIVEVGEAQLELKPTVNGETAKQSMAEQIKSMEESYVPKFKYKLEADERSKDEVENEEISPTLTPELEKDYLKKIQKDIDSGKYSTDVGLEVPAKELSEVKQTVASVELEAPLDLNNAPAIETANLTVAQVSAMEAVIKEDGDASYAINEALGAVAQINNMVATIKVRTQTIASTGGLIPQHLSNGGTFTGAGRVAGYDPTDSDKVNAKLTGGEFVFNRESVDAIGVGNLYTAMFAKSLDLPKFADGGAVGGSGRVESGSDLTPINLNIGNNTFKVSGDRENAEALIRFIEQEGGL